MANSQDYRDVIDAWTEDLLNWAQLLAEAPDSGYYLRGLTAAAERVRDARAEYEHFTGLRLEIANETRRNITMEQARR